MAERTPTALAADQLRQDIGRLSARHPDGMTTAALAEALAAEGWVKGSEELARLQAEVDHLRGTGAESDAWRAMDGRRRSAEAQVRAVEALATDLGRYGVPIAPWHAEDRIRAALGLRPAPATEGRR